MTISYKTNNKAMMVDILPSNKFGVFIYTKSLYSFLCTLIVSCNNTTKCNDHGICGNDGTCVCNDNHYGIDCSSKSTFLKILLLIVLKNVILHN